MKGVGRRRALAANAPPRSWADPYRNAERDVADAAEYMRESYGRDAAYEETRCVMPVEENPSTGTTTARGDSGRQENSSTYRLKLCVQS